MSTIESHNGKSKILLRGITLLFFLVFLVFPLIVILFKAFTSADGITIKNFTDIFSETKTIEAFKNSIFISLYSSIVTTIVSFVIAYTLNYTNLPNKFKNLVKVFITLPMFLPTITYGFAIMYSFGNQGFWTNIFGTKILNIYGFNGLVLGYFIYTLPISFILINNGMKYVDKKYSLVSRLLMDSPVKTFINTVFNPLKSTLAISVIQCFFLAFTDFGIPASIGGKTELISKTLYEHMMGAIPSFSHGAVIAIIMLLPALASIIILKKLDNKSTHLDKSEYLDVKINKKRDFIFGSISTVVVLIILSIFLVIFLIPFVKSWPYEMHITIDNVINILSDNSLLSTYKNSIVISLISALIGTIIAYITAIFTTREKSKNNYNLILNSVASLINTVPGMVLGIAYLLAFSGTTLQNTLMIIIISNIVHYFSTPYLMFKDSLNKLNQNWEVTAKLLGDSWGKTIFKILTPNIKGTIVEVFSYYFINSMVTVSAVIFIVSAQTMVMTTKIKELQYYGRFNDIFVLSLLILFTNLVIKILTNIYLKKKGGNLNEI